MSKNIVFCADGTWNGPGDPDGDGQTAAPTNVFKLFFNLDGRDTPNTSLLKNEQEKVLTFGATVQQHAKYLHGVGDSDNFLVKVLGGALGAGLIARIVRGYTYISRNYVPGDNVFIIGFSRGAYTARALAGLIAAKGLLDAAKLDLSNNKITAYRLGAAVWYDHLRSKLQTNPDWLGRIEEMVLDWPVFFLQAPSPDQLVPAPMAAVAVWDTVGSLGIPEYNVKLKRLDAFQFADLQLSPAVRQGRHAVAIDEMRTDFTPTLWDADPRITQALFVGSHSDVGGGYPESNDECALSDAALKWMTGELARLGVRFSASPAFVPKPGATGPAHSPWDHPPWNILVQGSRRFPDGLALSQAVVDRLAGGNVFADFGFGAASAYDPANLTKYISRRAAAAGVVVLT